MKKKSPFTSLKLPQNFLKNHQGQLNNSLDISLLFFNFMPKQSTHVAGYIAPFSLCKIYRSNITDNSFLMSPVPPLSPKSVLFSKLSYPTFLWRGGSTLETLLLCQKVCFQQSSSYIIVLYFNLYDAIICYRVQLFVAFSDAEIC